MTNYRRLYIPGGTFFFTIVTYNRRPYFTDPENIIKLRQAVATVKAEMPFIIIGAVVLPDHLHFLWTLPDGDTNYSQRIGRLKALFTQSVRGKNSLPTKVSLSRQKHRESDIWQRRFWEHQVRDEDELNTYLNYIHYNPVKHELVSCPHAWQYSSFKQWMAKEMYPFDWYCQCQGKQALMPKFDAIATHVGE